MATEKNEAALAAPAGSAISDALKAAGTLAMASKKPQLAAEFARLARESLLDQYGCHKQVARWLESGTYRSVVHRHDGTFVAADESERKMMRADTIPLLADALMNWPQDAEVMPETAWVKVSA